MSRSTIGGIDGSPGGTSGVSTGNASAAVLLWSTETNTSLSLGKAYGRALPRVAYFYDPEVGTFHYGGHPMKPLRIKIAHSLILNYGLTDYMDVFRPYRASLFDMTRFHTDDYVSFLARVTPQNEALPHMAHLTEKFNVRDDCPVFEGLWPFCRISAGGTIGAAMRLAAGNCDIAINWAGGLHHAKKACASGFCYINDAVLGILELLKTQERVLYVDIDVHHGDGVEEAFYITDRVMTYSVHMHGGYFPGTGALEDIGSREGAGYSVNVPLKENIRDDPYHSVYTPVLDEIMLRFNPTAIVCQCGADSLTGDRLGVFNLSLSGHAAALATVARYGRPLLVLGGGGYTIRNVARCWTFETSCLLGKPDIPAALPHTEFYDYFAPDYRLHIPLATAQDNNTPANLAMVRNAQLQMLREKVKAPPSVPHDAVLDPFYDSEDDECYVEDDANERITRKIADALIHSHVKL